MGVNPPHPFTLRRFLPRLRRAFYCAGFVALVRIVAVAMPGQETIGWQLSLVLAAVTMTVGNVLALWQDNVRRLLAYSSIAHSGYMLIGLAIGFAASACAELVRQFDGVGAMLFYLAVYGLATIGTFAALTCLGRVDRQLEAVDDVAGVGRTHPWAGLAQGVFMFSLPRNWRGDPPRPGRQMRGYGSHQVDGRGGHFPSRGGRALGEPY